MWYIIKSKNAIVSTLAIGVIGTSVLVAKKIKQEKHIKKINLQITHAKDTLNKSKVYGSWVMKKNNNKDYVGAINVLENDEIIERYFEINSNYQFKWINELQEDY